MGIKRTLELDLDYMPYCDPPRTPKQLYQEACSNDEVTVNSWRDQWIAQIKENQRNYGFANNTIAPLFGEIQGGACIVAGSGPSMKWVIKDLAENQGSCPVVSVLHNFHYMIDHGIDVKYFVSLDAGDITIGEMSEGGKESHEYYVEKTKDHTLVCFIGTHPKLLESWKGKVLFFNAPIPDKTVTDTIEEIEPIHTYLSTGGNVLGAATYLAKIMGAMTIGWIGADFSFSYDKKFHPWDSKYDGNVGKAMRAMDVWGNSALTWKSYYNFKCWFESISMSSPGLWVNCSEGGCLGSWPEGNIKSIIQMRLAYFLNAFNLNSAVKHQFENPQNGKDPKDGQFKILF